MKNSRIIKGNEEFQKIINKRNIVKNKSFIINIFKKEEKHFRYGISVGKKIGIAVNRNKIKRQVRMMVKKNLANIVDKKMDVIIVVRKVYLETTYKENELILKKLIECIK